MLVSISTLLAFLGAFSLAQNTTLPLPNGPLGVDVKHFELIDASRIDPYFGGPRRLMVSVFRPTGPSEECTPQTIAYGPAKAVEALGVLGALYGLPSNTNAFDNVRLPVCPRYGSNEARFWVDSPTGYPVLLFSHGLQGSRLFSASQAQAVASYGYLVITIDHPGSAWVVEYPDGTVVLYAASNFTGVSDTDADVRLRSKDASFVLNQLSNSSSPLQSIAESCGYQKTTSVGIFGHSLGGATSARAVYDDERFKGALNFDGYPYGFNSSNTTAAPVFNLPKIDTPFLLFNRQGGPADQGYTDAMNQFTNWKKQLEIEETGHLTFTDAGLLIDVAGLRPGLSNVTIAGVGTMGGLRARELIAAYVVAFFDMVLKGKHPELLNGPSEEYPEVKFLD